MAPPPASSTRKSRTATPPPSKSGAKDAKSAGSQAMKKPAQAPEVKAAPTLRSRLCTLRKSMVSKFTRRLVAAAIAAGLVVGFATYYIHQNPDTVRTWTKPVTERLSKVPIGRLSEISSQVVTFASVWWTRGAEILSTISSKAAQTLHEVPSWSNITASLHEIPWSNITAFPLEKLQEHNIRFSWSLAFGIPTSIGAAGCSLYCFLKFISRRRTKVD